MAIIAQVMCINKREHDNQHERITHIGGVNAEGTRWKLTESAAMLGLDVGQYQFHVRAGGKTVWVVVATHLGRKYLKTTADGYAPNNLLNLPECP